MWIFEDGQINLTPDLPITNSYIRNSMQRYLLMVLFYSLDGEKWFEKTGYGSSIHACDWHGIECNTRKEVNGIILLNNDLRGLLPTELFLIPNIINIILGGNEIYGTIPTVVCSSTQIRHLQLYHTSLSG